MIIKAVKSSQIDVVKDIEIECGLSSWSIDSYLEEIERSDSLFLIALDQSVKPEKVVGFIISRLIMSVSYNMSENLSNSIENDLEIFNIGVRKLDRNRHVGSNLLSRTIETALGKGIRKIYLEVRKSNSEAISFYKKHDFQVIGERKAYYSSPPENALLMCRILDL